jgi:hypothetical protein
MQIQWKCIIDRKENDDEEKEDSTRIMEMNIDKIKKMHYFDVDMICKRAKIYQDDK